MKNYHELYQDRYTGGAIKTYTFVNNTLTAETNEQKEYEIRMLKYARMILISGYAVSLVATTLGSFLMLILRRLRNGFAPERHHSVDNTSRAISI